MKKSSFVTKTILSIAIACIAFLAFASAASLSPDAPSWTSWRGPNGSAVAPDESFNPAALPSAKLLWKINVGMGYSSVAVSGGFTYTIGKKTDDEEILLCLEAASGKIVWSYPYPSGKIDYAGSRCTPVIDSGKVYVMGLQGFISCVDATTGKKLWENDLVESLKVKQPSWGFASSALIEEDLVVFNVCKTGVALDKATGKIVWKSASDVSNYATPVAFSYKGKRKLVMFGLNTFSVVDAATGKVEATTKWSTGSNVNAADPLVIGEDSIFVSSSYDHGCALFKFDGKSLTKQWENTSMKAHFGSPLYYKGYIYGPDGQASGWGRLVCLDPLSGKEMWGYETGIVSLIVAGGNILAVNETGSLIAGPAESSAFVESSRRDKASSRLTWTAPILCDGVVYLRSNKGDLNAWSLAK